MLIVEDNMDHWFILQHFIHQVLPKVEITWVSSGKDATDHLDEYVANKRHMPSLILLDLYLPKREEGLQLLWKLKSKASAYSKTPVIMLSYSEDVKDIQDSYQAGCTSYMKKPLLVGQSWHELVDVLKQYWWETSELPSN